MAQDEVKQPIASSSATGIQQWDEPQLSLSLNTIIESYKSQRLHLADACWQIEEIILGEQNLTNLQCNNLWDHYTASIEEVAARHVFTIGWGRREGDDHEQLPLGETGDEAIEPP